MTPSASYYPASSSSDLGRGRLSRGMQYSPFAYSQVHRHGLGVSTSPSPSPVQSHHGALHHHARHDGPHTTMLERADPEGDSQPRKRIAVACGRCRKRKIRCSGDPGNGGPCSNCKNAGHEPCLFLRVSSQETPFKDSANFDYDVSSARTYHTRGPLAVSPHHHSHHHRHGGGSSPTSAAMMPAQYTDLPGDVMYRQNMYASPRGYTYPVQGWPSGAATYADDAIDYTAATAATYAPYSVMSSSAADSNMHLFQQYGGSGRASASGHQTHPAGDPYSSYTYMQAAAAESPHTPTVTAGSRHPSVASMASESAANFSFSSMAGALPTPAAAAAVVGSTSSPTMASSTTSTTSSGSSSAAPDRSVITAAASEQRHMLPTLSRAAAATVQYIQAPPDSLSRPESPRQRSEVSGGNGAGAYAVLNAAFDGNGAASGLFVPPLVESAPESSTTLDEAVPEDSYIYSDRSSHHQHRHMGHHYQQEDGENTYSNSSDGSRRESSSATPTASAALANGAIYVPEPHHSHPHRSHRHGNNYHSHPSSRASSRPATDGCGSAPNGTTGVLDRSTTSVVSMTSCLGAGSGSNSGAGSGSTAGGAQHQQHATHAAGADIPVQHRHHHRRAVFHAEH